MCGHPGPRVHDHQLEQVQRPNPSFGVRRPEPRQQQGHQPLEVRDHKQLEDAYERGNLAQPDDAPGGVCVVELHVAEEEEEDVRVPATTVVGSC